MSGTPILLSRSDREAVIHRFRRNTGLRWPDHEGSYYDFNVTVEYIPWRSLLLALVTAGTLSFILPTESYLRVAAWIVPVIALPFLELSRRADFLTQTALVRCSGIFRRRRQVIPLQEIESVEYFYPRFGESTGIGDIIIMLPHNSIRLIGIEHPAAGAQLILNAKERLLCKVSQEHPLHA